MNALGKTLAQLIKSLLAAVLVAGLFPAISLEVLQPEEALASSTEEDFYIRYSNADAYTWNGYGPRAIEIHCTGDIVRATSSNPDVLCFDSITDDAIYDGANDVALFTPLNWQDCAASNRVHYRIPNG